MQRRTRRSKDTISVHRRQWRINIQSGLEVFFFFFPYRPISFFWPKHADILPKRSDSARIGANPSCSARISMCQSRIGASRRRFEPRRRESGNPRGTTRHEHAVCGVPPASPRPCRVPPSRTRVRWARSHVRASQLISSITWKI